MAISRNYTIFATQNQVKDMIRKDVSLLHYNTFGMDVTASHLATFDSQDELKQILKDPIAKGTPLLCMGGGSNLLFLNDFDGLVLHSAIKGYQVIEQTKESVRVKVGSGETWDDFVALCVKNKWYGAENLSGIPGQVGASAIQNIGAYGVEAKDIIEQVECVHIETGDTCLWDVDELDYGYRHSRFKTEWKDQYIITAVTYRLSLIPHYNLEYGGLDAMVKAAGELSLKAVRESVLRIRNAKLPDPKVLGNAGSFFMNPIITKEEFEGIQRNWHNPPHFLLPDDRVKIPAAWLIDQAGWKGKQIGQAAVHDTQPLVLVNKGKATGEEVIHLSKMITADVYKKFNIRLHREVILVE